MTELFSQGLHFEAGGAPAPESVPLLLGSSIGTTGALWADVAGRLGHGRAVIRWDLPGHGGSPSDLVPTDGTATVADFAGLVLALADRLGFARFDYAGDSFGGAIGTWLAARHPDRVRALAIVCSSARFGDPADWRSRAKKVRTEATAMAELAETAMGRWFPAGAPIRSSDTGSELSAAHAAVDPAGYAACCDAIAELDLTGQLARIAAPTLVIAGRQDPATPPPHARELADGIAGSTLLELSGVGHLAPIEAPERVAAALAAHLDAAADGAGLGDGAGAAGGAAAGAAAVASAPEGRPDDAVRRAAGMSVRRAVLGDAHVDLAVARTTPFTAPFQDLITRYAWGEIWTRPGLDRRTRSCVTLTALVAHGHLEELAMHVRAARNNGLSPDEIGEVLLQSAIYCGVPAANAAFAVAQRVLAELGEFAELEPNAADHEEGPSTAP
ncbi:MAG TPA: 4-carboxymuconolactone decarboxylase [Actinospica sp.]|nr:4-carboxymuconolactone decarboxylase [Actinospica sp.]